MIESIDEELKKQLDDYVFIWTGLLTRIKKWTPEQITDWCKIFLDGYWELTLHESAGSWVSFALVKDMDIHKGEMSVLCRDIERIIDEIAFERRPTEQDLDAMTVEIQKLIEEAKA